MMGFLFTAYEYAALTFSLCCYWCPSCHSFLSSSSAGISQYYCSTSLNIQRGCTRFGSKQPSKKFPSRSSITTKRARMTSETTSTINECNHGGSLLLSTALGNSNSTTPKFQLILASQSPRRAEEIMDMMGLKDQYMIKPSPLDEKAIQNELTDRDHALPPQQYARILAEHKAKAVGDSLPLKNDTVTSNAERRGMEYYVIGSDTIVEIDGTILEKPADEKDARNMLTRLSGRWHSVHTGVSIYSSTNNYETPISSFTETAQVKFTHLTTADIEAYIKTQEPMDKAGSYGIQGIGGQIVESIQGDFFAVMGLPMHKLSRELAKIIIQS